MWTMALLTALTLPADLTRIPDPPREFRGVWVATVANIDWPSKPGLPTKTQQAELLAILDTCQKLHFNAVVLQVRPMCDALYSSKLEPWSEFLSGELGKAPQPFWDPLEFAVREAHRRGLELHAWFNPYRAHHPSAKSAIPSSHLVKKRPDLARPYGKHHWLVPTNQDVQDHSLAVFLDVVKRYDIDGIHIDDYFYPYKEKDASGKLIPFPDDDSWAAYQKSGGTLSRDDWRRDAVNRFIQRLYLQVKLLKPHVKVGISPFGIWRPGYPPGIQGFDQYAELYADAKLWLNKGWIDYFTPQLYWPIRQEKQSYPRLLAWWASENSKARHLWPGIYTSRVTGAKKGWLAQEIVDQISLTRKHPDATGNVHFSMKALMKNSGGIADELAQLYREPALVPASAWLSKSPPPLPQAQLSRASGKVSLKIQPPPQQLHGHVLRFFREGKWSLKFLPASQTTYTFDSSSPPSRVVLSAIDRAGLESPFLDLKP